MHNILGAHILYQNLARIVSFLWLEAIRSSYDIVDNNIFCEHNTPTFLCILKLINFNRESECKLLSMVEPNW